MKNNTCNVLDDWFETPFLPRERYDEGVLGAKYLERNAEGVPFLVVPTFFPSAIHAYASPLISEGEEQLRMAYLTNDALEEYVLFGTAQGNVTQINYCGEDMFRNETSLLFRRADALFSDARIVLGIEEKIQKTRCTLAKQWFCHARYLTQQRTV